MMRMMTSMTSLSARPTKHIPQRTCIACRKVKDKKELIRVVRVSDKIIEVDIKGKKAGRGAYLCKSLECWENGFKGGRLEHTFKASLAQENREALIKFGNELFGKGKEESPD